MSCPLSKREVSVLAGMADACDEHAGDPRISCHICVTQWS